MTMFRPDLEEIAAEIHESTGIRSPVDAFVLAEALGVECYPVPCETGFLAGDRLYYPEAVAHVRQQGQAFHELGHWTLEDAGRDPADERAARYLAGALSLPEATFRIDMDAMGRDLARLREVHVNASYEMIAVRLTQLGGVTVSVWEKGELLRTYGEHDPHGSRSVMMQALECGLPCRGALSAYPVFDGTWRRVIVVG